MYRFKNKIWLTAALLLTLTACGGGGGGGGGDTVVTTSATTSVDVFDGAAIGCSVSSDGTTATEVGDGAYTFATVLDAGTIVTATGCTDTDTQSLLPTLSGIVQSGAVVISPITTLIVEAAIATDVAAKGANLPTSARSISPTAMETAIAQIVTNLGLGDYKPTDPATANYVAAAKADATGTTPAAVAMRVSLAISTLLKSIEVSAGPANASAAVTAVSQAIANSLSAIDLSQSAGVEAVMTEAKTLAPPTVATAIQAASEAIVTLVTLIINTTSDITAAIEVTTIIADFLNTADDTTITDPTTIADLVAAATITVNTVNNAPVAMDASVSLLPGGIISGMLAINDVDGDNQSISIVTGASNGTLTLDNTITGAYTYVHGGTANADSFTFWSNDGLLDSNIATVTVTTVVPDAPASGLLATAGDQRVTLYWDAVPGADSYNVYWANTPSTGIGGTKITGVTPTFNADVATSGFNIGGATNGQNYYFVVTAVNAVGESAASNEINATPVYLIGGPTRPENPIANDLGFWDTVGDSVPYVRTDQLGFTSTVSKGYNHFEKCFGENLFHVQHVVRLPNKDNRGYFMVSQSGRDNGFITVLQTNPDQLDSQTDLVRPPASPRGEVGKYIWATSYPSNGNNPIGSWNHPGKMEVIGGLLVVTAQNWSEAAPCDYGMGSSPDALLFYDVSDPEFPEYIGMIDEDDLGVNEISNVTIFKLSSGQYILNAGGDGRFTTWIADEVKPTIETWSRLEMAVNLGGQYGMGFKSYQNTTVVSDNSPPAGTERYMFYNASDQVISFTEWVYISELGRMESTGSSSYHLTLPGSMDDGWASTSLYVTKEGEPIIYAMEFAYGQHGVLYQIHSVPVEVENLVAVGTDGILYTSTIPATSFTPLPNSTTYNKDVTILPDGRVVALRTDGHLYVASGLGEVFSLVPNTGNSLGVTSLPDGRIVVANTNGYVYVAPELGGAFVGVAHARDVKNVTSLPDGRIVLVGNNGYLYVAPSLGETFTGVANNSNVKGVAGLRDGAILTILDDGFFYLAPSLGEQPALINGIGYADAVTAYH